MNRLIQYLLPISGLILVILCWAEMAHRLSLYHHYGNKPFYNHVSEQYFGTMHHLIFLAIGLLCTGIGVALFQKRLPPLIITCIALCAACVYLPVLNQIHAKGMLVTYTEYADHYGP